MNRIEFGNILASKRKELGLSLARMAERAGLSASMLNQLERGGILKPSYDTLLKICRAYNVNENDARLAFFEEARSNDSEKIDSEIDEFIKIASEILSQKKILSRRRKKDILKILLRKALEEEKLTDKQFIAEQASELEKSA